MKKNILIFGLIAGAIVSLTLAVSLAMCYDSNNFSGNMVLGFTMMILAFAFIFVGIKNYRDKFNGGLITFGTAFKIGALIAFIASTMYVITWLIIYYNFMPDFMDKYAAHIISEAKADGLSPAKIAEKTSEMAKYKEMYKSPIMIVLLTYMEILPLGLVVALICSFILKRKTIKVQPFNSNESI